MRYILMPFAILYVIYLRGRFKRLNIKWEYSQSNQHLAILKLLQAKIFYFYTQFNPWGYYHPSCTYGDRYVGFIKWLFPPKDYRVIELVNWHNPEAVTYYHNMIYKKYGAGVDYDEEITKQLKKWGDNY